MSAQIVAVVGNPRPASRTHQLARDLAAALAAAHGDATTHEIDLAVLGPDAATEPLLSADLAIVASPTYKATYSGLLKSFLDRIPAGALGGTPAIGLLLGGAPDHRLAVDVHLTPLLLELGAAIPLRGLFVLEAEVDTFRATADTLAAARIGTLLPPGAARREVRPSEPPATPGSAPTACAHARQDEFHRRDQIT